MPKIIHEIAGKVNIGHEEDVMVHSFSNKPVALLPQELVWAGYIISIAMYKNLLGIIINNSWK